MDHFISLPIELVAVITEYLPLRDLASFRSSAHCFTGVANSLWRHACHYRTNGHNAYPDMPLLCLVSSAIFDDNWSWVQELIVDLKITLDDLSRVVSDLSFEVALNQSVLSFALFFDAKLTEVEMRTRRRMWHRLVTPTGNRLALTSMLLIEPAQLLMRRQFAPIEPEILFQAIRLVCHLDSHAEINRINDLIPIWTKGLMGQERYDLLARLKQATLRYDGIDSYVGPYEFLCRELNESPYSPEDIRLAADSGNYIFVLDTPSTSGRIKPDIPHFNPRCLICDEAD